MPTVAVVQTRVDDGQWKSNLARALALIDAAPDADIYLLPELWTSGYAYDAWRDIAESGTPAVLAELVKLAKARNAAIGGSMISLDEASRLVNRFWYVSAGGRSWYDKIHLFPPLKEPELLTPGASRVRVEAGGLTLGLSTCFDLRFPTMYRRDALDGAHAFLVASEWPASRADALRTFSRSRALENQAYLVLCNRTGVAADGLEFGGGSVIFSPMGAVLAELGSEEGCAIAELDAKVVEDLRSSFPVLSLETADA